MALTGGTGIPTELKSNVEKVTSSLKEIPQETTKTLENIKESSSEITTKITEKSQEIASGTKQLSEKAKELTESAKELSASKLPARLVSIPKGTSVPGCEGRNMCYDPPNPTIFVGGEIIWKNDDDNAYTVTSGTVLEGPDGKFDSGLINAGNTFVHRFDKIGDYQYFCVIYPWANGSIIVT